MKHPERLVKPALFVALLLPFGALTYGAFSDGLGANPVERITHETGEWALRSLIATLAVSPLRRLSGWNWLVRLRRMLGLFAFFYAALHLTTYVWLDHFFDWGTLIEDVLERPYITLGFAAVLVMVPLAVTSTDAMVRRLGGKRWRLLHRGAYVAAMLACGHFLLLVKADIVEPLVYASILTVLLLARLAKRRSVTA